MRESRILVFVCSALSLWFVTRTFGQDVVQHKNKRGELVTAEVEKRSGRVKSILDLTCPLMVYQLEVG